MWSYSCSYLYVQPAYDFRPDAYLKPAPLPAFYP